MENIINGCVSNKPVVKYPGLTVNCLCNYDNHINCNNKNNNIKLPHKIPKFS